MRSLASMLFLWLPLHSATHYIRDGGTASTSGTGSCNSGGSGTWETANACDNLPTTLVRGDTYCIADGSYGGRTFSTAKSGTTLITIKKATIADHCSQNTGWLDTYGDGQAIWTDWGFDTTGYITLTGVSRTSISSGHGFKIDNGGACNTELILLGPSGGTASDHITIEYTELAGRGYAQSPCSQFWADRGFYTNATTGVTSNITIRYCHIYEMYVPFLTRQVADWLVEYNYIHDNLSTPDSHAETWSDAGSDNVVFRYNILRNPEGSASIFVGNGGTSGSPTAANTSANWEIYGNIWYQFNYTAGSGHNDGIAGIIYCANDPSNRNYCDGWVFYNNTIHDIDAGTSGSRLFFENVTGVTAPIARNNIWSSCASSATHNNVTLSHNWYWTTTHTSDASNEQSGSGNPFVDSTTQNFHLAAATNAGQSLSSPYDTDLDGVTRGGDGTWDRGAFEFGTASAGGSRIGANNVRIGGNVRTQ